MTAAEKRIAGFILSEPRRAVGMTMRALAAEVGVSEGSVANFASHLGFDGFTAMKIAIAGSLPESGAPLFENVSPGDSPSVIMGKMRDNTRSERPAKRCPRAISQGRSDCSPEQSGG